MLRCDGDFLCFFFFWDMLGFVSSSFFLPWEVNLCSTAFVFAWVGLRLYLRYLLFSVGGLLVFLMFSRCSNLPPGFLSFRSFFVFRHSHFLHPFNLGSLFLGYNIYNTSYGAIHTNCENHTIQI